ncbi:hypothetical protein DVJ78_03035 [Humibacter sp. BT305]|nr:hypothetical protein DVJ78_03035 [Humibacter sp. BT305]
MTTTRSVLAKAALVALPLALALGAPAAAFAAPAPAPPSSTRTVTADAATGHSVPGIGARTGETSRCTRASGRECLTSPQPPIGTVGVPYSYQINVDSTKVDPAATITISGSLPSGLTFDPTSRMITGTPTRAGVSGINIGLSDADGSVLIGVDLVIADASTTVTCEPTILTRVDRPEYLKCTTNQSLLAGTWSAVPNISQIPPGMRVTEYGEIVGTPTVAGTYQVAMTFTTPTSSGWTWVTINVARSIVGTY